MWSKSGIGPHFGLHINNPALSKKSKTGTELRPSAKKHTRVQPAIESQK